jgi:hypothetical protein
MTYVIELDRLAGDDAVFTLPARFAPPTLANPMPAGNRPMLSLPRSEWEDLGRPTKLRMTLEDPA